MASFLWLLVIAQCVGYAVSGIQADPCPIVTTIHANLVKKWEVMWKYFDENGSGYINNNDFWRIRSRLLGVPRFRSIATTIEDHLKTCVFPVKIDLHTGRRKDQLMHDMAVQLREHTQKVSECRDGIYSALTGGRDAVTRDTFVAFELALDRMDKFDANQAFDAMVGPGVNTVSRNGYIAAYFRYHADPSDAATDEFPLFGHFPRRG